MAWRSKSMMQKSRADLYSLRGIGQSGLIAIAQCTVVYFEVCSVIWPLYAKGCFGESAGLALRELVNLSLSRRMPVAQHQSGRDFPVPNSPRH